MVLENDFKLKNIKVNIIRQVSKFK